MPERRPTLARPSWSETDTFVPRTFVQPFQRFMHAEAGGAIVMLAAAVAALLWANSPWHHAQEVLWHTHLTIHLGGLAHIDLNLVGWINDALMAIFFFTVGLEIKRELVHGESQSPLDRLESKLHLWVAFVIVPLFAFSNAGVRLTSEALDGLLTNRVVLGIVVGLVVGKPLGVFTFTYVGEKLGIGALPGGITYRMVLGLAITAGIGFTVALFIAGLAYEPGSVTTASAKIGILAGSVIAGALGFTFLKATPPSALAASAEDAGRPAALVP